MGYLHHILLSTGGKRGSADQYSKCDNFRISKREMHMHVHTHNAKIN